MNGSPSENLTKVFELMGGVEKIIGSGDVVMIKPNVQEKRLSVSGLDMRQ